MELQSAEEKPGTIVTSSGYCYSDISSSKPNIHETHLVNQLQSFESNPEIYSLSSTGMQILGFPPKNNLQQQQQSHDTNSGLWKGFFTKSGSRHHHHQNQQGGRSSSKQTMNESTMIDFHQHDDFTYGGISDHTTSDQSLMVNVAANSTSWHDQNRVLVDDSSFRCVFPCEGNERPSQGLSLSLSSSNPSTIGLQSFELRQEATEDQLRFVSSSTRSDGFYGNSMNMQDEFLGKAPINLHHHQGQGQGQGHFLIKNSKYLGPTQQLLNEFCNLGTKQQTDQPKIKPHKTTQWQDENAMCSSSKKQSLNTLEILELQKRKTKLLSMLEEVNRRYRGYCDQMKDVVLSFEEAAGNGAAMVYSAMASKAMSRHFRCLRDGIVDQIKTTKKTMGEKDTVAPGSTRGETPRLRLLDQTLRQQRAFQQMSMMESHPWRPQRGLPDRSVSVLRAWLFEHFLHPYPSDVDKHILSRQTGLSRSQVSNWFINARVRLWKPMVEEMYLEETKEQDKSASSDGISALGDDHGRPNQSSQAHPDDQKPAPTQLIRIDSECFSSIINNPDKNNTHKFNKTPQNHQSHNLHHHHQQQHSFGRVTDTFGAVELDFSSYARQHFGGGGNGSGSGSGNGNGDVSLTLGLQQHGGSGVSLAFSPPSHNSLLYPRDHIEDCQTVHQYSLLDGEGQNLPYRNLMGAQLLHDLAR